MLEHIVDLFFVDGHLGSLECLCFVAVFNQFVTDAVLLYFLARQMLCCTEAVDGDCEVEVCLEKFPRILDLIFCLIIVLVVDFLSQLCLFPVDCGLQ